LDKEMPKRPLPAHSETDGEERE